MIHGSQKASYGGLLDPQLVSYMEQQRTQNAIQSVSRELMRAGARGADFGPGLLMGLGGASGYGRGRGPGRGGNGLLDVLKMQSDINTIRARQKKRRAEQQRQSDYTTLVGGEDPMSGIDWQTGRVAPATQLAASGAAPNSPGVAGGPLGTLGAEQLLGAVLARQGQQGNPETRTIPGQLGFTPAQQSLLRSAGAEAGLPVLMDRAFSTPKAPTIKEFKVGDQVVTRRWEPSSRSWIDVGESPRWAPGEGGGPTASQTANNAEIDQARARLEEMEQNLEPGVSLSEDIHRRIGVTDPATGRITPDYNSFLGRTAWQAMQRKVGEDDADQARWSRVLINPPSFSEPAGAKQLPPGESAEPPGLWQQTQDFLFGPGSSAGQPSQGAPASGAAPRRGRRRDGGRIRGRSGPKAIESMSQDEIMDLIYGDSPLTQSEINRLDARLNQLGVGKLEP